MRYQWNITEHISDRLEYRDLTREGQTTQLQLQDLTNIYPTKITQNFPTLKIYYLKFLGFKTLYIKIYTSYF